MVKKKVSKKSKVKVNKVVKKVKEPVKKLKKKLKINPKNLPTLHLKSESDIAMDFASKVYKKFNKVVKSIILFGSAAKKDAVVGSDIDLLILIDDVSIGWDQELIAWYREELEKIVRARKDRIRAAPLWEF